MKKLIKVGVVCPGSFTANPYLNVFKTALSRSGIPFVFITMNRNEGIAARKESFLREFRSFGTVNSWLITKVINYLYFFFLVAYTAFANRCGLIIVSTLQATWIMSPLLLTIYKGRYILDIRDYSKVYELNKFFFKYLILNSRGVFISSEGFKNWLPNYHYVVSHNVSVDFFKVNINAGKRYKLGNVVKILTIGKIRDLKSNIKIIDMFAHSSKYEIHFAGVGQVLRDLKLYAANNSINNVFVTGSYQKIDEDSIANKFDFINICLGDDLNSLTLLANRFYLALKLGIPVVANYNSYQGSIVYKYNLGVCLSDSSTLNSVHEQISNFNFYKFHIGRSEFLKKVTSEQTILYEFINALKG